MSRTWWLSLAVVIRCASEDARRSTVDQSPMGLPDLNVGMTDKQAGMDATGQPKVKAKASTPGSRNSISNRRSAMGIGCRIS